MPAVTLRAPAKLNLALGVGAPVPEGAFAGYHPIASWMAPLDLADAVTLTALDSEAPGGPAGEQPGAGHGHRIVWEHTGEPVPWDVGDDLAVRMLHAVRAHTGRELRVRIEVRKRIPAGGGLGGGSSDAAAVLAGLDRLFGLGLSLEERRAIAVSVGTDCVFFVDHDPGVPGAGALAPRPALVTGFGDGIERVGRVPGSVALIFPDAGCPTGAVYRAYDRAPRALDEGAVRDALRASLRAGAIAEARLFNDLDAPARAVTPAMNRRDDLARTLGRPVHMSGSGSTLWCPIGDGDGATSMSQVLGALPPGWTALGAALD